MSSPRCFPLESGPSAGKSSLLEELRRRGFGCVDESAIKLIQSGVTPEKNRDFFQTECLKLQLEGELPVHQSNGVWFIDRGLISGVAYYLEAGLEPAHLYDDLDLSHYACAFVIDPLKRFVHDGVRRVWETREFSMRIADRAEQAYASRGIATLRVPEFETATIAEAVSLRADFVLAHCRKLLPLHPQLAATAHR